MRISMNNLENVQTDLFHVEYSSFIYKEHQWRTDRTVLINLLVWILTQHKEEIVLLLRNYESVKVTIHILSLMAPPFQNLAKCAYFHEIFFFYFDCVKLAPTVPLERVNDLNVKLTTELKHRVQFCGFVVWLICCVLCYLKLSCYF